MYIVKFSRDIHSFWLSCDVWSKEWSDEMNSHSVALIGTKKTLFYFVAKRWANKIVLQDLLKKERLDFING